MATGGIFEGTPRISLEVLIPTRAVVCYDESTPRRYRAEIVRDYLETERRVVCDVAGASRATSLSSGAS
jgi:hypothetical protein